MAEAIGRALRGAALPFPGAATALLLLGCASPAPPRPPSLRLPEKAAKLEAERVGDEVRLSWVNPSKTTDGGGVRGPMTAVICRESATPAAKPRSGPAQCTAVQRRAASSGPATTVDLLPEPLRAGSAALLGYRVELLNAAGRSAGNSDAVYVPAGQAPPPAGPLTLTPQREAVLVKWAPHNSAATMEVKRTLLATATGPVAPKTRTAGEAGSQQRKLSGALKAQGLGGLAEGKRGELTEVVLTDAAAGSPMKDAGGMVDKTVEEANTYTYVAQRVQRVTLEGHALELRGVASPAATFTYHDSFPPAAPIGLMSVPGGGFGVPLEVDLSWEPGAEDNLAGYFIYRRTGGSGFVRLNQEPLALPAYRDMTVQPGQEYVYRVTAVDRLQHESAASGEIHESLRK